MAICLIALANISFTAEVTIKGRVTSSSDTETKINMPVNGNYFSSNNAYITTDKQGAYSHTFSVLEPRFVTATNNFVSAYLFVELGHIYQVDYVDDSYKMGGIPYYMILDKNGQPVVWNAKRPSDKNELIEQLKNVIRKNSKQFLTLLL